VDLAGFLGRYPPFDLLAAGELQRVVEALQIEFFPQDTVVLDQGGEPAKWLYVVRSGAVELVSNDVVLDHLGPGEVFGHRSLVSGLGPASTVRTLEDTICYLIDHDVATRVLGTPWGLAFFSTTLGRRIERALEGAWPERADPRRIRVGALIERPAVTCPPAATVREAAELMVAHRISSLLISCGEAWGIVTDRDLRGRVLAAGRSPETAVGDVMSFPAMTVGADVPVPDVLAAMLDRGVHHFPVVDAAGRLAGVVTDTDLLALERNTPIALKREIERAGTVDALVDAGCRLPDATIAMVDASVDPIDVAGAVAIAVDALTRRLLEMGIRDLGEPPAPWAWLALGGEGRHEQSLHTDQDNALAYDPKGAPAEEVDPYFEALAGRVNDGLEAAGIPRCPGGVMASNHLWRRTLDDWRATLDRWMREPAPVDGGVAGIAFDLRVVDGTLPAEAALSRVLREAPQHGMFLRRIGRAAVDVRPPTGFVRDLVVRDHGERAGTLDVTRGGIVPITNLARFHALRAGITEPRTLQRLREAASMDRMEDDVRAGLEEGFRLLWQVRLEHQCDQVRRGLTPDDLVDPKALGPITRRGLKETFGFIDRAQSALAGELSVRR
jgi:CBS domain-containing protein